jgi:hypothetical protein
VHLLSHLPGLRLESHLPAHWSAGGTHLSRSLNECHPPMIVLGGVTTRKLKEFIR